MEEKHIDVKAFANGKTTFGIEQAEDPSWNVGDFRFNQNVDEVIAVPILSSIEVRRPHKQEWFRVHSSMSFPAKILEVKKSGAVYLVHPSLAAKLTEEIASAIIFPCINRSGELFMWPVKTPGNDGRADKYSSVNLEHARRATEGWLRRVWSQEANTHHAYTPGVPPPDPEWPESTIDEFVQAAFKGRFIGDLNHEVLRKLRGEL